MPRKQACCWSSRASTMRSLLLIVQGLFQLSAFTYERAGPYDSHVTNTQDKGNERTGVKEEKICMEIEGHLGGGLDFLGSARRQQQASCRQSCRRSRSCHILCSLERTSACHKDLWSLVRQFIHSISCIHGTTVAVHCKPIIFYLRPVERTRIFSMSELQRSFAKAKLAGLPFEPPLPPSHLYENDGILEEDETDDLRPVPESTQDDDSSSASSASSASSTGTIRPSPSKHLFARPKGFVPSP